MSTTYSEFKSQIVDMGFEEDDVIGDGGDYERVLRNATNRAQDVIYTTVALQIEPFLLMFDNDWETPEETHIESPTKITSNTKDSFVMSLSDFLMPLLPLLTAYYVWIDDDIAKATYYYNQYDSMKQELMNTALKPRAATIEGGF